MNTVKNNIRKVRIISNNANLSKKIEEQLTKMLIEADFEVVKDNPDLVVFIGGDGTFLSGCQMISFDENVICIGINAGTLGILQNYDGTLEEFIRIIKETDNLDVDEIPYLEVILSLKYKKPVTLKAINEVSVIGDALALIMFRECVDNTYLQNACSAGLIISSSIGSTGISKDFGSPIIATDDKLIVRNIIGGNTYKIDQILPNSIVCREYRVNIEKVYKNAKLQIDGIIQEDINVKDIFSVNVRYSDKTIKSLSCKKDSTRVEFIREKLIRD